MTISGKYRPRLVVMVKEPRPGRVKTRLGKDIGLVNAAWWYRHQTQALLQRVTSPKWDTILAVSPDIEGLNSRVWPRHFPKWPQGRGDLGVRMARIFADLPPGPIVIIGSDIPDVSRNEIDRSFAALGSAQAVFGPAFDGGYWLVGLKRFKPPSRQLFRDVRWSTKFALRDSMASMGDLRIAKVQTLRDVDTATDL